MRFTKLVKQILVENNVDPLEAEKIIQKHKTGRSDLSHKMYPGSYQNPPDEISLEQWYYVMPNTMKDEYPEADYLVFVGPDREENSSRSMESAIEKYFRHSSGRSGAEKIEKNRYKVNTYDFETGKMVEKEVNIAGPIKLKNPEE